MLHILWLIIKFILIALGIVLGLLLLAILLVLFCPVRYQASGVKERCGWKEAEASARISWLFRLISVNVTYQGGNLGIGIRLFGISLEALQGFFKKINSFMKRKRPRQQTASREKKRLPEKHVKQPDAGISEVISEQKSQAENVRPPEQKSRAEKPMQEPRAANEKAAVQKKPDEMQADSRKTGLFQQIWDRIKKALNIPASLLKKASSFPGKMMEKLRKMQLTLQRIYGRIDWWKGFLFHPRTKAAVSLVWQNAKGLVRHMMPVKIVGSITFGSEDPAVTGAVLAVMGMTFPFHKNRIEWNPLFDGENQLTGNVKLKGRIYGIVFLKAAIVIYFNKNIKYVISRWKHKEG